MGYAKCVQDREKEFLMAYFVVRLVSGCCLSFKKFPAKSAMSSEQTLPTIVKCWCCQKETVFAMTAQWGYDEPPVRVCWSCDRFGQFAYHIGFKDGMTMDDEVPLTTRFPCLSCGTKIEKGVCCAQCSTIEFSGYGFD